MRTNVLVLILSLCTVCLWCSCSSDPVAGGSSQQGNARVSCTVISTDGTMVPNAMVRLRKNDYFAPIVLLKTTYSHFDGFTNDSGFIAMDSVDIGYYYLEIAADTFNGVVIQFAVIPGIRTINLGTHEIKPFGTISGSISRIFADTAALFLQLSGMERLVAVDSTDHFVASNIPEGKYCFRLVYANPTIGTFVADSLQVMSGITTSVSITVTANGGIIITRF